MSTDEAENDHDYAASRLRNQQENEQSDITRMRRLMVMIRDNTAEQLTSRNSRTSNTDHNYIQNSYVGSSNITINASGGTMEDDHDIFGDDERDDESTDTVNVVNSGSTTATYDTDTRSEDSGSVVTTISSEQSNISEQSNSSELSSVSEGSSASTAPSSIQSDLGIAQNNSVGASNISDQQEAQSSNPNNNAAVINLDTPSPPKKRKRVSMEPHENSGTPKVKSKNENDLDDEDDGLTCPICLDNWEMSGEHRLASLKCGHLFGDSCIRRWLQESSRQSGHKVCPQCKTKAHPKEIRYLYAKRLRAIDRSEEHRMREQLVEVQNKAQTLTLELATLKMSYAQVTQKLKSLEADNDSLTVLLRNGGGSHLQHLKTGAHKPSLMYKLFMDRNIEITKEPGCRVLTYAKEQTAMIVSQKSTQNLFPGYGLRFIDTVSFRPTNFLHTSVKLVRDISLSDDQQLLAAASMETKVKLFDLRTLSVSAIFQPEDKPLWSCSLGRKNNEHYIYLGSQHGSVYLYDLRFPETLVLEYRTEGDLSPVIQIATIPTCQEFPGGGFLVCKLTSMWFHEHVGTARCSTRLPIEGRFISMDFDPNYLRVVIQTRSCARFPRARYILANLTKSNGIPMLETKVTFFASTNSPVMARCSQIAVDSNTLVAAYIQDSKLLSLYDANREQCVQSLPAQDIIYDTCPIYTKDFTYLAALTETKCRVYKLNST